MAGTKHSWVNSVVGQFESMRVCRLLRYSTVPPTPMFITVCESSAVNYLTRIKKRNFGCSSKQEGVRRIGNCLGYQAVH